MVVMQTYAPPKPLPLPRDLERAGFEVKTIDYPDGPRRMLVGPSGRPFAPAETYLSLPDIKTETNGRAYATDPLERLRRRVQWAATPAHKSAFWKLPGLTVRAGSPEMAFALLPKAEQKALFESSDPSGGYLTPPDFLDDVLRVLGEAPWAMGRVTLRPTERDIAIIPRFAPNSSNANLYATQLAPIPVTGETPARASASPTFGTLQIPIVKLRSMITLSRDLLMDATALEATLRDAFAADLASQINFMVLNSYQPGGLPSRFDGVLDNPAIATSSLGGGAGHTLDSSTGDLWRGLRASLPSQFRDNAVVVMSTTLESAYTDAPQGNNGQVVVVRHDDVRGRYLFGEVPLQSSAAMPAYPPSATSPMLVYGDFSQYYLAQRADVSMSINFESVSADFDEADIVLWWRGGGAVFDPRAFKIGTL